jgi:predicted transposase/invertase (TIGR01784 family)
MYLLFEHRSTPERQLPRRLLRYIDGIWEQHDQQHGGMLPIVLPILVCHAPGGWTAPTAMQDLFAPSPDSIPDLAQHVPHFRVIVEDLAHLSNDQLKQRALATFPKLALWLLRDARDAHTLLKNLDAWRESFREALQAPYGMQAVAQLLRYIYCVSTDLHFQQFREKIREQLQETEETAMTIAEELIQQGRMEGRMEGRAEALMRLLVQRFGSVPERYRERFAAVTDEQFDRFCQRMFEVSTLEAVFDD